MSGFGAEQFYPNLITILSCPEGGLWTPFWNAVELARMNLTNPSISLIGFPLHCAKQKSFARSLPLFDFKNRIDRFSNHFVLDFPCKITGGNSGSFQNVRFTINNYYNVTNNSPLANVCFREQRANYFPQEKSLHGFFRSNLVSSTVEKSLCFFGSNSKFPVQMEIPTKEFQ